LGDKAVEAAKGCQGYQPQISIDVNQLADAQVIEIMDNGIGMNQETCRKAFEPLFTTRARGTGIGLSNVKKIIEEHDGRITLESKVGHGTQVTLTLPSKTG
jgi:signal transduction histidine kinase